MCGKMNNVISAAITNKVETETNDKNAENIIVTFIIHIFHPLDIQ